MRFFLTCFAIVGITLLEATLLPIPLTLIALIFLSVFQKEVWIVCVALVAGIFLDSFFFRPIGVTGLFFLMVIGLILLYGRKFETASILFLSSASTIASVLYLLLFQADAFFLKFFLAFVLACGSAFLTHFYTQSRPPSN